MVSRRSNKVIEGVVSFVEPAAIVLETPLSEEMEKSFLEYSYSVIYSRALPAAEDGLKPVQRRLIYTMLVKGYTPDKSYVKSARPVADCMGTYHPHGDSSIYQALVHLAQSFTMRVPLVDGFGNFGGQPGDSPAAARYTEARMSKQALLLAEEIKENTVEMRPNYDGETVEPVVLPVQFPNLLINGGVGIAVGMATKMPPHNPTEAINAARWLLTHPNSSLEKLMEFIPAPDFPTGGLLIGTDGIKDAYETGKGAFRIRGKYHIESIGRAKSQIIFTELPYGVPAIRIVDATKKAIEERKIQGISDIRDLTDRRSGIRLVFETKMGVNPEAVVADLFKYTLLEDSFNVNNNCLVAGEPKVIGLKEMLEIFLAHRMLVVTNRTTNRLDKKKARLHLVEGLLKALADLDKIIAIVRKSTDADIARASLIKSFKVDGVQADYILSLQLRRLTKFDQIELDNEKNQLLVDILALENILSDDTVLRALVAEELVKVGKLLDTPRLSILVDGSLAEHIEEAKAAAVTNTLEVEDAPCYLTLLASGALVRSPERYKVGLRGKVDPIVGVVQATTRGHFVAITNKGRGFRLEVLHVAEDAKTAVKSLGVSLHPEERIVALSKNAVGQDEAGVALGTRKGSVKIVNTDFPLRADTFEVIKLDADDEVLSGGWVGDSHATDFVLVSSDASLLRFSADKVRPQGRLGAGVAGIKLADGAHVVGFAVVTGADREKAEIITYTGKTIKRSLFSPIPVKGRATGGMRLHLLRKDEAGLQLAYIGVNPLVVDKAGKHVTLPDVAKRDAAGSLITEEIAVIGERS